MAAPATGKCTFPSPAPAANSRQASPPGITVPLPQPSAREFELYADPLNEGRRGTNPARLFRVVSNPIRGVSP